MGTLSGRSRVLQGVLLAAGLVILNASLTFTNVWPTLAVDPSTALSLDAALCVFTLVMAWRWLGAASPSTRRWLAVLWVALVIGHYASVTARSLYGRDVNLYWDLRLMPDVGAMFAFVAHPWAIVGVLAAAVLIPLAIYVPVRWALGRIADGTDDRVARRALGAVSGAVVLLYVAQSLGAPLPEAVRFAEPVTQAVAREARQLAYEMTGAGLEKLGPPLEIRSDLARVDGADVFLIFLESYGAVSWERPELAQPLAGARAAFEAVIRDTGRGVASALVESTTFGGESWLAHISLLSGTAVRDQGTNVRLMAQRRDTLVKAFGRHGYRTIAIMPGVQRGWPQGAFYGFEDIYDLARLNYHGPPFGWWDITDQFALAQVDALEIAPRARRPVFAVFPTISTHAPFTPAPPYQPDWARVLTPTPYDAADLDRAWSDQPDWLDLGPGYVKGLEYAHATIGGYLRFRADRDLVMIVVGDHQPPALVSGEGASWDVPVHVIASRRPVLDRLRQLGFSDGLAPRDPAIAQMHTLLPLLLDAFGDQEPRRETRSGRTE